MSEPTCRIGWLNRPHASLNGVDERVCVPGTVLPYTVFDLSPGGLDWTQVWTVPRQRQKPGPRRFDHRRDSLDAVDPRVVPDHHVQITTSPGRR